MESSYRNFTMKLMPNANTKFQAIMVHDKEQAQAETILAVFREHGHRHYGENVSELEYALQAAEFARQFGESDAVVLSCLLHDYGHMLHDLGEDIAQHGVDARHGELGAEGTVLALNSFDQKNP